MRRLLLIGLAVACAAAAGLGFAFSRGGSSGDRLAGWPDGVVASAPFKTVSWGTTGRATIEHTASGKVILRFSGDFRTQRAPDLYVHMGDRRMALKAPSGDQVYVLKNASPSLLSTTVEVFCEKCNKAWGQAKLMPTARKA